MGKESKTEKKKREKERQDRQERDHIQYEYAKSHSQEEWEEELSELSEKLGILDDDIPDFTVSTAHLEKMVSKSNDGRIHFKHFGNRWIDHTIFSKGPIKDEDLEKWSFLRSLDTDSLQFGEWSQAWLCHDGGYFRV